MRMPNGVSRKAMSLFVHLIGFMKGENRDYSNHFFQTASSHNYGPARGIWVWQIMFLQPAQIFSQQYIYSEKRVRQAFARNSKNVREMANKINPPLLFTCADTPCSRRYFVRGGTGRAGGTGTSLPVFLIQTSSSKIVRCCG